MIPDLFILADSKCGLGHVRRQQVLEAQWKHMGGKVKWSQPFKSDFGIVSIDDYYFKDDYRVQLRDWGYLTVYWNEFEGDFHSDLIINQNIGAEELKYPNAKYVLAGSKYFMLRENIMSLQISGNELIFDCDSVNRGLSPDEFSKTMASARAIICSAGLTAYEAIYLRKPVFLRLAAENQRRTYDRLIEGGWAYAYTPEMKERLQYGWLPEVKDGRLLIDGKGPERVANRILFEWRAKEYAKTQTSIA